MGTIRSLDMIYKSAILYLRLAFAHALNDWFNITPVQLITCGTRLPICGCFIQQTNRLLAVLVLLIFAVNKHNIRELSTLTGIVLTMKGLEQAWGVRTPISETRIWDVWNYLATVAAAKLSNGAAGSKWRSDTYLSLNEMRVREEPGAREVAYYASTIRA